MAGIGRRGAFGGYKHSGVGREWGHHGFESFTEVKHTSPGADRSARDGPARDGPTRTRDGQTGQE
jgi:hypothetical protein